MSPITEQNGSTATSRNTPSRRWAEAERQDEGHGTMTTVDDDLTGMATTYFAS